MDSLISLLIIILYLNFSLLVAWGLDRWLGDPERWPHPVVLFGKVIAYGERCLNKGNRRICKGACLSLLCIIGTYLAFYYIIRYSFVLSPWLTLAVETIFIFFGLAGTTLIREVREVFRATDRSLEEGRKQVARIVGRDTSALSAQEIRTAALETLAENLSDGVIAPLFWYALLGVPGMMAYKMINTLDSMIGYKNERYKDFGCIAAHIDDFANYIPARLTAVFMALVSGNKNVFSFIFRYGHKHASPNSGYPEAALAGILDGQFGGPHSYFGKEVWKPYIGTNARQFNSKDMELSVAINKRSETLMMLLIITSKTLWVLAGFAI